MLMQLMLQLRRVKNASSFLADTMGRRELVRYIPKDEIFNIMRRILQVCFEDQKCWICLRFE